MTPALEELLACARAACLALESGDSASWSSADHALVANALRKAVRDVQLASPVGTLREGSSVLERNLPTGYWAHILTTIDVLPPVWRLDIYEGPDPKREHAPFALTLYGEPGELLDDLAARGLLIVKLYQKNADPAPAP